MPPKLRRNFSGAFLPQQCGPGAWQLSSQAPQAIKVYLRDAELGAAKAFGGAPIVDLGIEWHGERVLLTFKSQCRVASVAAANAIVHEPLARLYESLPLARIDSDARRFWGRVFRLVRLPGGRYLMKVVTRSNRR